MDNSSNEYGGKEATTVKIQKQIILRLHSYKKPIMNVIWKESDIFGITYEFHG